MDEGDSTMEKPVAESTQDDQATTSEVIAGEEAAPTTSDVAESMEEAPQSSENATHSNEAPTQDEAVASSESEFVEQPEETVNQVDTTDSATNSDGVVTITTIGETPVNLSSLTQVSQISSDQSAEVTTISGLPPGVSLIQAEQGQDGEGAIFLLVTGPVDGEGGTANAIAVDAATAAAMASLQNPLEAVTSGQSISIEELATAVSTSTGKNQNDSVAEILSSLTGERMNSTTDDSAVVQVAANAEAQAAATSKAYPTPSEVSLAQDILALASSALSSSASKTSDKGEEQVTKVETSEEFASSDVDGKPSWAVLLSDFQRIGDSYYGFVKNEVEMDQVLNSYKKETNSLFAIRQTPSPVKEENGTVRLMWKSQHVPYDGIPFINIGRRATVMECEHGPRKKTNALKRMFNSSPADKSSLKNVVNLTCPARVFVKKVRKFPEFKVISTTDPKVLRTHQEQSLKQLRELGMNTWNGGEVRLYMQLPDPSTHRYHMSGASPAHSVDSGSGDYKTDINHRVVTKIKEVVRQGVISPFIVRQIARHYVEKEMVVAGEDKVPKHDKTYFPPMIEIQNLIQQIQADLLSGVLTPLPMPEEGYPQTKAKKRRSSTKSYGEPAYKRSTSNGDSDGIKTEHDDGQSIDGTGESTTIGTFSLTLPEGQLENFSIANLNMEQLQQLAKIGLLALNNATSGKSSTPLATATVTDSGTIEIEASASQAESTSGVDTSGQLSNEAVVLLTSSMQDQVTSSEAQEAVQAIESGDLASSTLEESAATSSAGELPNMAVSGMETGEAQPSTTTSDDVIDEGSVVSSAEATTTTENNGEMTEEAE